MGGSFVLIISILAGSSGNITTVSTDHISGFLTREACDGAGMTHTRAIMLSIGGMQKNVNEGFRVVTSCSPTMLEVIKQQYPAIVPNTQAPQVPRVRGNEFRDLPFER